MKFTANKQWLDDNTEATIKNRPTATLTLYRYPDDGTKDYETASPVSGNSTVGVDNTKTELFTITIPSTENEVLPMFNEDGYKYIYFAKENITAGTGDSYEQIFVNNGSLKGKDKFVFNTGTIENRITGTVTEQATKKWVAAARQDVDAQVTISVDQTNPDPDPNYGGTIKDYRKTVLEGFGAEITQKTATFTDLPKYDPNGYQYSYSIRESDVKTKADGEFKGAKEKGSYFVTADGFRYRQDTGTDKNGVLTVTNTLVGNAQVKIVKKFPGGLQETPTNVVFTIYRNGEIIGTKKVSYTSSTNDPLVITKYSDMDGNTDESLLPRYDEKGNQYRYTVEETSYDASKYEVTTNNTLSEGTYTEGEYKGEKYTLAEADISNNPIGKGVSIKVVKKWIDDGDMLYHLPVHAALYYQKDSTSDPVLVNERVIAISTDYTWITVGDSYADLYKSDSSKFYVVETALGDNLVQPDSEDIKTNHPEHETDGWSFVTTPNQNYDVSPKATVSGNVYTLTNKRVGVVRLYIKKQWVDGNNGKNLRPQELEFTLTKTENGTATEQKLKMTAAADLEFPSETDENRWFLKTEWLQKYDYDNGSIISYDIDENITQTMKDNGYGSSKTVGDYVVGDRHTGDTQQYQFKNTLTGKVYPQMNKYWMDLGTDEVIAARPDIYPVLYQKYYDSSKKTTIVKQMAYQDRDWTLQQKTPDWWVCKFVGLDRYTTDGYEISYYVGENFASTSHGDYECSGAYADQPVETASGDSYSEYSDSSMTTHKQTVTIRLTDENGKDIGDPIYVAQQDYSNGTAGTIVNKPIAKRTVSGIKVWENLPAEFSKVNLPQISFLLWRYPSNMDQTKEEESKNNPEQIYYDEGKQRPCVATLSAGASAFSFKTENGKEYYQVDKYDEEGKPYNYIVTESGQVLSYAYTMTNSLTNGLAVHNAYIKNQGLAITFTKNWVGVPTGISGNQLPKVTLTLVRYLTTDGTTVIPTSREANFATVTEDPTTTNGNLNSVTIDSTKSSIEWKNLAYYGPNSKAYAYYVEEIPLNGYNGYLDTDAKNPATKNASGVYEVPVSIDSGNKIGTASLTNKYTEVVGSLNLIKKWDQYVDNLKPESITLQLWRYATDYTDEQVGTATLNKPTWEYSFNSANNNSLQIYAPNGKPYHYYATETAVTGYSSDAGRKKSVTLNSTTAADLSVTNSLDKVNVTATKAWGFNTPDNSFTPSNDQLLFGQALHAIPVRIRVQFKYSLDGGATYDNVLQKTDSKGNVIDEGADINCNSDGSWTSGNWDLPKHMLNSSQELVEVKYQVYEYSVTYKNLNGDEYTTILSGENNPITSELSGQVITNSIPMEPITITKVWNDEYNRDFVRPSKVEFTITRSKIFDVNDSVSTVVTLDASNKVGTNENIWSKTYYVPVYWNKDNTTKSSYSIDETAVNNGYTVSVSSASGTSEPSLDKFRAESTILLGDDLNKTDAVNNAWFKNSREHGKYSITPSKTWALQSGTLDMQWYKAYLPASIDFKLQREIQNANGTVTSSWADIDPAAESDFSGQSAVHKVQINSSTGAITSTSYAWTDLPACASDTDVTNKLTYHYRVVEVKSADQNNLFDTTYSSEDITSGSTIEVTNTLKTTDLSLTKTWNDTNNKYLTRPVAIKFKIQQKIGTDGKFEDYSQNGVLKTAEFSVSNDAGGNLKNATVTGLPSYALVGDPVAAVACTYQAVETDLKYQNIDGTFTYIPIASSMYTAVPSTGGTVFTNSLKAVSLTVNKTWSDNTSILNMRPSKITFKVQRKAKDQESDYTDYQPNGTLLTFTASVAANGELTGNTLGGLPKESDDETTTYLYRAVEYSYQYAGQTYSAVRNGNVIGDYTVSEGPTSTSLEGTTFTTPITNTIMTTSISANKNWSDNSNIHNVRPDAVTLVLNQNGNPYKDAVTLSMQTKSDSEREKTATWNNLPVNDKQGSAYTYTVTENAVGGYHSVIAPASENGTFTVTNTELAAVKLTKVDAVDKSALSGAKFALSKKDGTSTIAIGTYTTGTDGTILITGLDIGNYTLTETESNGSHVNDGFTAEFAVTEDCYAKTLVIDSSYLGTTPFNLSTEQSALLTENAIMNTRKTGSITVQKIGIDEQQMESNQNGVVFTLTKPDKTTQTLTTDKDGIASLSGLSWGEYSVEETTPFAGYKVFEDPIEFTIDASHLDIKLTGKNSVVNHPTSFTLTKSDGNTGINGAVFKLDGDFSDGSSEQVLLGDKFSSQTLYGMLIAGNTYTLSETKAPDGYQRMLQSITVTVAKNGTISLGNNTPENVTLSKDTLTVSVVDPKIQVSFKKIEQGTTTALDGSEFTVSGKFVNSTSPVSGKIETLSDLLNGKLISTPDDIIKTLESNSKDTDARNKANIYTMKETKAPNGYQLEQSAVEFVVDDQSHMHVLGNGTIAHADSKTPSQLVFSDQPLNITLFKTDGSGNKLSGAEFSIDGTFAKAKSPYTFTSSTDGASLSKELIVGNSYTLTETKAPDGYDLQAATVTFTIGTDNKISITEDKTNVAAADNDKMTLSFKDEQTGVSLLKTDADGKAIKDAELKMEGTFADGTKVQNLTSGTDPIMLTGKLIVGNTYTLTETKAPNGYTQNEGTAEFTLGTDNKLTLSKDANGAAKLSENGLALSFKDEMIKSTIQKVGTDGKPLANAEMELAGTFADGTEKKTFTSSADAAEKLDGVLIVGSTYSLTETKAPDGCLRLKDAVKFTVNKVGTLKLADGTSSLVSLSKDEKGIVVKDDVIAVTMTKTDRVTKAAVSSKRGTRYRLSGRFVSMASPVVASDTELTELSKGQLIYTTDADIQTLKQDYESGTAPDPAVGNVYTLQEVEAPAGYTVEKEAIDFVVSDQGDVTVLDKDADVLTSVSGSDLNFSDPETVVSFKKVNEGGTVLTGAALEVDGTFADGTSSKQFTTSADLYTLKTMLIVGNTYQLKETAAPSGYYLQSEVAEFTMDDQGVITLTKDAGGAVKLDGTTLIMTDKKIPPVPESPVTPSVGGSVFTGDSSRASLYLGLLATGMIGLLGSAFWFLKKKRVH